jgi:NAD+ kinase
MIDLSILVDGEHLTDVAGDGLIIATPTGSTAHNTSAGGPIVEAELAAFCVTPICPHSLTHRPIVVRPESEIVLEAGGLQRESVCVVDGQEQVRLARGDRVHIRRAGAKFLLVQNSQHRPFETLREKMVWGQAPRYGK